MLEVRRYFDDFKVGDYAYFSRRFTSNDFKKFSTLSGDKNRLHHDVEYAACSEYINTIVPLHLTSAPLSYIAGMIFPGESALYLGHDIKAVTPVFYGDELTYSARIVAVNRSHRVLTLDIIVFRGLEVVLTATMKVRARLVEWMEKEPRPWFMLQVPQTALITGASGGIGSAIARLLAKSGWNLLLHYQSNISAIKALAKDCRSYGIKVNIKKGPLEELKNAVQLGAWAAKEETLSLVIHAASPGIRSPLDQLAAVNFMALKEIADQVLPRFLSKQNGSIVYISSNAINHNPVGWENYVASKVMGTNYMAGLHRLYGKYGIRCETVAPGYVQTSFSKGLFRDDVSGMLPEEAAESIVDCIFEHRQNNNFTIIKSRGNLRGDYGFYRSHFNTTEPKIIDNAGSPAVDTGTGAEEGVPMARLASFFRSFFKLDDDYDTSLAELGITPEWDSLRHIELLLEIESMFGVNFSSTEIDQTCQFAGIARLLNDKLITNNR